MDDNGILLDGGPNGLLRISSTGISVIGPGGGGSLLINSSSVFLTGPQGAQLVLFGGGASLETPANGSLGIGLPNLGATLTGPDATSVLQLRTNDVKLIGAGASFTMGKNGSNSQVDLGAGVVQVASGQIGLGGFCHGVVRSGVDLVHNTYQYSGTYGIVGWENGTVPSGSPVVWAC